MQTTTRRPQPMLSLRSAVLVKFGRKVETKPSKREGAVNSPRTTLDLCIRSSLWRETCTAQQRSTARDPIKNEFASNSIPFQPHPNACSVMVFADTLANRLELYSQIILVFCNIHEFRLSKNFTSFATCSEVDHSLSGKVLQTNIHFFSSTPE